VGETEIVADIAQSQTEPDDFVNRLIGSANEHQVVINGVPFKSLLDSGSMVTTMSHTAFQSLNPKVILHSLDSLGLNLSVADGSSLKYSGYIEATVSVPFLSSFNLDIPVLVIPDNDFNSVCPVIIGTNVLRRCKAFLNQIPEESTVPSEWQLAMDSLESRTYPVKVCGKKTISVAPFESVTINGMVRNFDDSVTSVVTETSELFQGYTVCPRVVKLHNLLPKFLLEFAT
jgi:hypothetical protein